MLSSLSYRNGFAAAARFVTLEEAVAYRTGNASRSKGPTVWPGPYLTRGLISETFLAKKAES
jgi:hypothetical protein